MADFYQKIVEQQGSIEDIARKIPGFGGYLDLNDRRQADQILRERLVRSFEEDRSAFTGLQKELISTAGLEHMERVQGIDTKLQTFISRIESAAQGYTSVFGAVKVREDALARLYAFDNALIMYHEQFQAGLEQLKLGLSGEVDLVDVLRQLDAIVDEANNTFKRRVEAMEGLDDAV